MSDFPAAVPARFEPEGLLETVLDVSLTPLLLLRPWSGRAGPAEPAAEATDFALDYLNPAGQRLLALPAHPGGTLRTHFPGPVAAALLAFCRRQCGPNPTAGLVLSYPGPNHPLRVAARRHGEHLVISLLQEAGMLEEDAAEVIDTQAQTSNQALLRTQQQLRQLSEALASQAREHTRQLRQARAEADRQQQRLERFFRQAPAAICVLDGPDLVFELINPAYQQLFPGRRLLHRPLLEALPELAGQPVWQALQQVYMSGETHEEIGTRIPIARTEGGPLQEYYFHHIQQARYNDQGQIDGIIVFAIDMTEHVRVRERVQGLQAQVQAGTRRLAQERETFYQAFARTPAAICILRGPEHRLEYFNAAYEQLFPDRQLRGRPVAEAQPEAVAQGFVALLDQVYQTGETY
ncbi:PAS domain-containing protein [Hymenobacter rubripertinctus]|uniref:PAS domain-containing protein n=1 Tax=Hymenobacter rubripertinctus TaxID=2029981 RepID=A0A418R088_9BACT|nr:PAS domain-containing protein [Hymenobacter rubripertinctus]RIY10832.1 PAS domain-containing protein [Hymenobacter rubripertinctus]